MNIGQIFAIWAITPWIAALMDSCCFNISLTKVDVIGMIFILLCALFIGFSSPKQEEPQESQDLKMDKIKAIMVSLTFPVISTVQVYLQKQATTILSIKSSDFTFGSYALFSIATLVTCIYQSSTNEYTFSWSSFWFGTIGSFALMGGSLCSTLAIATRY